MKVIQIRLNAVEEQMLKEVHKSNKTSKDLEAVFKSLLKAAYQKLA